MNKHPVFIFAIFETCSCLCPLSQVLSRIKLMMPSLVIMIALDNKIKMTRLIENKIKKFDALITPATPFTAPLIEDLNAKINQKNYDYSANYHRQFFSPFNVTGLPALVLPIGRDKSNMPIAMQIVGKKCDESKILQIAYNIEANILYNNNISF